MTLTAGTGQTEYDDKNRIQGLLLHASYKKVGNTVKIAPKPEQCETTNSIETVATFKIKFDKIAHKIIQVKKKKNLATFLVFPFITHKLSHLTWMIQHLKSFERVSCIE